MKKTILFFGILQVLALLSEPVRAQTTNKIYEEFGAPPTEAQFEAATKAYEEELKKRLLEEREAAKKGPLSGVSKPEKQTSEPQDKKEIRPQLVDLTKRLKEDNLGEYSLYKKTGDLKEVNLRGQFGPVRHQGGAGSCATFSSVAVLEAAIFRETGKSFDISEAWFIRSKIGSEIANYGPRIIRNQTSFYLGIFPEDILKLAVKNGLCEEDHYPYDDFTLGQFESGISVKSKSSATEQKAFEYFTSLFARGFGVIGDAAVEKCRSHNLYPALQLKGLRLGQMGFNLEDAIELISFGIPIAAGVDNFAQGVSAHAIVFTGVNLKAKTFSIRNSWGYSAMGNLVSFKVFENSQKANGFVRTLNWQMGLQFILSPRDLQRACANPEQSPRALRSFCEHN